MTGRYKAYAQYRESGIEWLKEMPIHWQLVRAKHLFKRVQRPVKPEDGIVTAFRDGEVTLRSNRRTNGFTNAAKEIGYQGVRKGDLLVHAMDGFAGAIGISDSDGKCSPVCSVCIPWQESIVNTNYYGYLVRQLAVTDYITSLAKGIRERSTEFRFSEFSSLPLAVPTYDEQQKIANFLDHETAKIDTLITKQEKLIKLLKEKRQAVISHAVTKGLTPDVPMKDSGVEWLGEVPEHWGISKLRFISSFGRGLNITKANLQDNGIPCVSYGEVHSKYGFEVNVDKHPLKYVSENYLKNSPECLLSEGDVIFADTSEDQDGAGNFTQLNGKKNVFAGYHTVVVRFNIDLQKRFMAYVFDSESFRNQIRTSVKGVKVFSVTQAILKNSTVWLPPVSEQKLITEYLDNTSSKIDLLISHQERTILLMKERKTALISAAVTGKIDVRNWELQGVQG
ncbi:restriction endonuclease subunit S [Photobacterium aquimaris]|uniref:Restriction endonuclease subunit S n=1 Tax=Photobacterium aquimaris TaxID=512643 RepID=A0A2T3IFW6_9GAMM|nr:restriction endonuclease subunit S [Photobacterium aquimaris]OBU21235.1 hypothetical protein AYY20_14610 [Photobacterium aquimaris]PSU25395.1 restriction endonuclease subunit S [Photobacterium aquimaris]